MLERMYKELNCNILIVGYRGYGHSEGKPSEVGIGNDGEAILKFSLKHEGIDQTWIFIYGKSLGGAVAV